MSIQRFIGKDKLYVDGSKTLQESHWSGSMRILGYCYTVVKLPLIIRRKYGGLGRHVLHLKT